MGASNTELKMAVLIHGHPNRQCIYRENVTSQMTLITKQNGSAYMWVHEQKPSQDAPLRVVALPAMPTRISLRA